MKPPRSFRGSGGERGRPDHHARPSPSGGEGRGERPRGGAQSEGRSGGAKFGGPHQDGNRRGGKPQGERSEATRRWETRPAESRLGDSRSGDSKPGHARPDGAAPRGAKPWSGQPRSGQPEGAQRGAPSRGGPGRDRPHAERPHGERNEGGFQPRYGENTLHARAPRYDEDSRASRRDDDGRASRRDDDGRASRRDDDGRASRRDDQRGSDRTGLWLYGTHAVAAALANPARRLRRLLLTEAAEEAIAARLPRPWAITAERAEREQLDRLLGRDAVHQGVALHADPLVAPPLAQVLERPGPLVVLDQLADPRNIGAILRSAAALGAAAVIVQDRHAPDETGALAKAASGALETMPLLRAVNIARTLVALKAANVFVVGLDAGAPPLAGTALAGQRVALVLGAEGEGLRRLTRETCDTLAGIAIHGGGLLDSLNVASACAIALYELGRG